MLENPSSETRIARARLQDEAGPKTDDLPNLIAELHGLVDIVKPVDDPDAFVTQREEFKKGFKELGGYLDSDLISPILAHLVLSAFDFSQTNCLLLLTGIVDHPGVAEFLVSTGILVSLTTDGYWGATCVRTRKLILGFVRRLLDQGREGKDGTMGAVKSMGIPLPSARQRP
jgi:hypothetical protein